MPRMRAAVHRRKRGIMTEIEEKKEYLRGYERAVRQTERINERINEMRSNRIGTGINYDGMPHAHHDSDLSDYAAMIDKELRHYMKARYRRVMLCKEISDKIERMDNEDEKDVLTYRYIRLMKWEDICVKMNHSWQHTHRIHKRALENFKM